MRNLVLGGREYTGLVSVVLSSCRTGISVNMLVANNIHHGCSPDRQ